MSTPKPPREQSSTPSSVSLPTPRALLLALGVAYGLVIARSLVYLVYEHSFFDSDQAIVGLMAKHLIEGRAFPLFYYGQTYLLAVDAWIAAPFFVVAGAGVTALHVSVIFSNLVALTLLVVGLVRAGGLRPVQALVATVFFAFAPPLTAASLIEAGANIGVFVCVPLLWLLRGRPLWFGAVLAVGFLNREFTVYAVPSLVIAEIARHAQWRRARWRHWLIAAVATIATWQAVQALTPYADLMGPGTRGQPVDDVTVSQLGNIAQRVRFVASEYPERVAAMLRQHVPGLLGIARVESSIASQGHDWLWWVVGGGLVAALVRAVWVARGAGLSCAAFGWYLVGVGLTAAAGYVATRPVGAVVDRYILLTLLLPIGIVAVTLAAEPLRRWRAVVIGLVAVWIAGSAADHVALARRYWPTPPRDDVRVAADGLIERGVTVAEAGYWRAYKLSFLTGERVTVAATEVVRIKEYRERADREGSRLLAIADQPCPGGAPVGPWYLCRARPD